MANVWKYFVNPLPARSSLALLLLLAAGQRSDAKQSAYNRALPSENDAFSHNF
jgi:hypothetical protein